MWTSLAGGAPDAHRLADPLRHTPISPGLTYRVLGDPRTVQAMGSARRREHGHSASVSDMRVGHGGAGRAWASIREAVTLSWGKLAKPKCF